MRTARARTGRSDEGVDVLVVLPLYCRYDQKTKGSESKPEVEVEQRNVFISLLKVVFGFGLLIGSSRLLVWGAVDFAKFCGVSDLVGLATVISPLVPGPNGKPALSRSIKTRDIPLMTVLTLSILFFGINWKHPRWPGAIQRKEAWTWT